MSNFVTRLLSALIDGAFTRHQKQGPLSTVPTPRPRRAQQSASKTHGDAASESASSNGVYQVDTRMALSRVTYDPHRDGDADPGEVVWTWIPYEDDPSRGKDRPVVVLARDAGGVYVLQMTSKDHDRDAEQEARAGRFWFDIGAGEWDPQRRPSEVRIDRVLRVPQGDIRREGAILPRSTFEAIVEAVTAHARNVN
ncbi:type II toxin-antitoxin system PemK/MazF family toxin [Schaalia suimastitidis]|uniref:type II toxin-antitoxin system PemK/MazF family toxin n=1 Tax=Schaalia suimastitidis TaxID=121163 RepID=UPI000428D8B6|nr:type II toxin-antitoxin system PemK/MazF family toxin [Schaalia suimastitidis]